MKYSDLYLIENPFPQKGIPREEKIMETTYIPDDQFFREFLSDIENNISKGFHVIVGDNGVGKTQILRFLEEKIKIKSDSNLIPICIKCVKVSDNVLNSFLSELLSESYKIGLFTQLEDAALKYKSSNQTKLIEKNPLKEINVEKFADNIMVNSSFLRSLLEISFVGNMKQKFNEIAYSDNDYYKIKEKIMDLFKIIKFLKTGKTVNIALLIDEIESLYENEIDPRPLLHLLRELNDDRNLRDLIIVVAFDPVAEEKIQKDNKALYGRIVRSLQLRHFDRDEIAGFIQRYLDSVRVERVKDPLFPFTNNIITNGIFELTKGHQRRIVIFCHYLIECLVKHKKTKVDSDVIKCAQKSYKITIEKESQLSLKTEEYDDDNLSGFDDGQIALG